MSCPHFVCLCVVVVFQRRWSDLRSMQVTTVAAFTHSITIYGRSSTTQITIRPQACFMLSLLLSSHLPSSPTCPLLSLSSCHFISSFFPFLILAFSPPLFIYAIHHLHPPLHVMSSPFLSHFNSSPLACSPSFIIHLLVSSLLLGMHLLFPSLCYSSPLPSPFLLIIALLSFICHSSPLLFLCLPVILPPVILSLLSHRHSYPLISLSSSDSTSPLPLNQFITSGFVVALTRASPSCFTPG